MHRLPLLNRLGRHCARHRRAWILAWVVTVASTFVVSLGGVGQSLFDRLETGDVVAPGEAMEAREMVSEAGAVSLPVLLRVEGADLADPEVASGAQELVERLRTLDGVGAVHSPMTSPGWPSEPTGWAFVAGGPSEDPDTFLVTAEADGGPGSPAQERVVRVLEEDGERLLGEHSSSLTIGGTGVLVDDVVSQVKKDLVTGEGIALPLSLLLMLVVFGGFVAAGLPIAGAIAVIGSSLALLLGFSHLLELDVTVVNIVTVMGLALSIDYGLLLVSRFREELLGVAPGVAPDDLSPAQVEEAVALSVATAGRTVFFSTVIVGVSLSGLMIFEAPTVRAIGAAGLSVVVAGLLAALTLVPALCAAGARRLARRRGSESSPDEGVFSRLAARVQRRPALTAAASVTLLLLLAAPALGLKLTASGVELLPPDAEQRVFFETLQEEFPALASPAATVLARADPVEVQAWAGEVQELPGVERVSSARPLAEGSEITRLDVFTEGGLLDEDARSVTAALRAAEPGFETWVNGQASALTDFVDSVKERAPWAAAWIVLATFVLLFLLTGSVVIPIKALLLNLVSLGASLGVVVWVFQNGHLEQVLGFESVGAVESMIPLLVLAFGFGLSMDYEVFLLARILELHEQGHDDDTAVRLGLQRSGRIITSAGLIMVIVFAGFAVGEMLVIKQTGVALALAVALDATLVRMVIVPATMTMLGRWNWWAPGWMRRVHARFGVREHAVERADVASVVDAAASHPSLGASSSGDALPSR